MGLRMPGGRQPRTLCRWEGNVPLRDANSTIMLMLSGFFKVLQEKNGCSSSVVVVMDRSASHPALDRRSDNVLWLGSSKYIFAGDDAGGLAEELSLREAE